MSTLKSPLYDQAGDGTGAGAGGGAGASNNTGVTKDEVAAMINGLDKRYGKQIKTFEEALKGLDGVTKLFGGMKPKKLAKLFKAAKSGKKNKDNGDGSDGTGDSRSGDSNQDQSGKNKQKQLEDPFKKKKFRELTEKVSALERERDDAKKQADAAGIDSRVNEVLGEFTWANPKARGSAFKELRPMVARDEDGDLVIEGAKFDSYIRAKVPEEYDYLLAPKPKSGSGALKGAGKGKGFDTDSIGPNSKIEELADLGREIAQLLPQGQ